MLTTPLLLARSARVGDYRATVNQTIITGGPTLDVVGRAVSIVCLPGIILATFVAAMLSVGGARLGASAVLGLAYGGIVVVAAGFVLVVWTSGENTSSRLALAILLGSIATSLFLTVGCLLTGRSAGTLFMWWSVIAATASLWTFSKAPPVRQLDFREVLSILAIGLLVAIWCRRSAGLLPILRATGVAPVWSDYFIHGTEIAQFSNPLALGHSSFLLVNQPIVFYHYAAYMLPAAVASVLDLPPLGLAASTLLPYGIFLATLGSYAFARAVTGEITALMASLALLLVPDASNYGFRNGFFGFHWLLLAAPGSGYGLGVAFTALTLVLKWQSHECYACLWLGLLVTIALFEFRAQIFLAFAPALAMTLLWETDFIQRHARVVVSAVLISIMVSALFVACVPAARKAWLHFSAFRTFMEIAHKGQRPTAYDGVYQLIEQHCGRISAWFLGLCALIPVALGALTFALPLGLIAAIRRTGRQPLDSFPLWCVVTWLGLVLLAPKAAHGDFTEYQHRPFVLVYAVTFVWTLLYADRAMDATGLGFSWLRPLLLALVVAILGIRTALAWADDPAHPRFEWGKGYFGNKLEAGLMEAATFVHAQAGVGDTFALIPTDRWNILDDAATRFAALADVPAYLARARIQGLNSRERRLIVEQRLAELNQIETTDEVHDALLKLGKIGVRFLVVLGEHGPRFDPDRSRAAFQTDGAVVYRITPTNSNDR
jgi:hypothetical protein